MRAGRGVGNNRPHEGTGGFLLMFSLFIVALLLTFTASALGRSVVELSAANRSADLMYALHLADGGLDDLLFTFRDSRASDMHALLADLDPPRMLGCTLTDCTLSVEDDGDAGNDANPTRLVRIRATGMHRGMTQEVDAIVELDLSAPEVYPYAVAGSTINMDGNATFGDPLYADKTMIYVQGSPPLVDASFLTSGTNNVWAAQIAFHNPNNLPLATLCPNCTDASTFHGPPTFTTNAPLQPDFTLDLKPYYDQAVATGPGHVIIADTTFENVSLQGVYYVECGVNVTFRNSVTLQGTIVHEGCGGDLTLPEQGELVIDSTAGDQFAPGMAIIGVPDIDFGRNVVLDIKGIVMQSGARSNIMSKTGLIRGSLLAVKDAWIGHPDLVSGPGPGQDSLLTFPLDVLHISEAKVLFSSVLDDTQDPSNVGVQATMLMWEVP